MTRYMLQKHSRAEEETRVHLLPLNQLLNSYGVHILLMTSESNTRITTALEAARKELGLVMKESRYPFKCDFMSLDSRIPSRKGTVENSSPLASTKVVKNVKIVKSCNGLLLCTGSGWHACYYVFNPSTNLFKRLPPPDYSHADSPFYLSARLRMDFDPIKSCNYKVVHAGQTSSHIDIYKLTIQRHTTRACADIMDGLMHFKLNVEDNDHPILTSIKIHQGLHRVRYFFEPLGNNLPTCIVMRLPLRFYLEGKLFESRGYLLAVLRHYFGSREFTIYQMRKGCSVWSGRSNQLDDNLVDDELIMPFGADHSVYEFILSSATSALQVLRRLGSIFTSVYVVKLKRVVSLLEGLQGGKRIAFCQKE
ncbi:hypothetical protein Tco_0773716 [Tanacetum coccineum]|uniref:Uncharacterized protein n=1 Tax=Tanacetum coccineum TaxID=301880 RepID=A0ABQ4ZLL8_9ASTR